MEYDYPTIDGNLLSKSELQSRLLKMDLELDSKNHPKKYYVDLYNRLVQQLDRKMKIINELKNDAAANSNDFISSKRARNESDANEIVEDILNTHKKEALEKICSNNVNMSGFMNRMNESLDRYKTLSQTLQTKKHEPVNDNIPDYSFSVQSEQVITMLAPKNIFSKPSRTSRKNIKNLIEQIDRNVETLNKTISNKTLGSVHQSSNNLFQVGPIATNNTTLIKDLEGEPALQEESDIRLFNQDEIYLHVYDKKPVSSNTGVFLLLCGSAFTLASIGALLYFKDDLYQIAPHVNREHLTDYRVIGASVILGVVVIYLFIQHHHYNVIAKNTYKILLENLEKIDDINSIGILEEDIISNFSKIYKMKENTFVQSVLPKLRKIRMEDNKVVENEFIINGNHKTAWNFRNK